VLWEVGGPTITCIDSDVQNTHDDCCKVALQLSEIISDLFCKKRTNRKILILQEKQDGGYILRTTNDLNVRIFPTYFGYS
jgi:hypothetical protein